MNTLISTVHKIRGGFTSRVSTFEHRVEKVGGELFVDIIIFCFEFSGVKYLQTTTKKLPGGYRTENVKHENFDVFLRIGNRIFLKFSFLVQYILLFKN